MKRSFRWDCTSCPSHFIVCQTLLSFFLSVDLHDEGFIQSLVARKENGCRAPIVNFNPSLSSAALDATERAVRVNFVKSSPQLQSSGIPTSPGEPFSHHHHCNLSLSQRFTRLQSCHWEYQPAAQDEPFSSSSLTSLRQSVSQSFTRLQSSRISACPASFPFMSNFGIKVLTTPTSE